MTLTILLPEATFSQSVKYKDDLWPTNSSDGHAYGCTVTRSTLSPLVGGGSSVPLVCSHSEHPHSGISFPGHWAPWKMHAQKPAHITL